MQMKHRKYKNRILARSVSHGVNHFNRNRKKYKNNNINENTEQPLNPIVTTTLLALAIFGLILGIIELGKYIFIPLIILFIFNLIITFSE